MARGRRRTKQTVQRGHTTTASVDLDLLDDSSLGVTADRRTYHPEGRVRPALTTSGTPARVTASPVRQRGFSLPSRSSPKLGKLAKRVVPKSTTKPAREMFGFKAPKRVWICIRRKMRRQVLHALKRTRGVSGKRKRNYYSNVRC